MNTDAAVKAIEDLRLAIIFSEEEIPGHCLFAIQHWRNALACLEQAASQMQLVALFQARESAGNF